MTAPAPLTKQFEIGPVVTVLRADPDKIYCSLRDLYEILGFMTGVIPSHARNGIDGVDSLGEAITKCAPYLAEQFPALAAEQLPADWDDPTDPVTEGEIVAWLVGLGVKHHAPFTVAALPNVTRAPLPEVGQEGAS